MIGEPLLDVGNDVTSVCFPDRVECDILEVIFLIMKTEWLVADLTSVGFPERVERIILGMVLGVFWPIQATFVVGGYFVM